MTHREQDSWQSEADNQAAPKEIKPKTLSAHGLEMELELDDQNKYLKIIDSKKRNKVKRSSEIPSKECEHCGFLNNANNNPNWAMMENPDILTASLVDPEKADELADLLKGTSGGDILCAKCGYNFWVSADELAGKETVYFPQKRFIFHRKKSTEEKRFSTEKNSTVEIFALSHETDDYQIVTDYQINFR